MLVLSRHKDEAIVIGEGGCAVHVTVVEIRGDKVRLGIQAPANMPVDRVEVRESKERGEKRWKDLGWQNEWRKNPPEYDACIQAGHQRTDVDRSGRGYSHQVTCHECKITFRYDSSG